MDVRVLVVGEGLGFLIGAQLGYVFAATMADLLHWRVEPGLCIAAALYFGIVGSVEGYITGGWVTLGRVREILFGAVAGGFLGVILGIVYTAIATRDPQHLNALLIGDHRIFKGYNDPTHLRRFCLLVGLSAGSVVGGLLGMTVGRMRGR